MTQGPKENADKFEHDRSQRYLTFLKMKGPLEVNGSFHYLSLRCCMLLFVVDHVTYFICSISRHR